MNNKLIAFDFGGTIAEMDIVENRKFMPVHPDFVPALTEAKERFPELFFGVATNGSTENVYSFLERNNAIDLFTNERGESLVLHGGQRVVEITTDKRRVPANFKERLIGKKSAVNTILSSRELWIPPKPFRGMVKHMMTLAGIERLQDAVLIGDSLADDAEAAKNEGIEFIYVGNGARPKSMHAVLRMAFEKLEIS